MTKFKQFKRPMKIDIGCGAFTKAGFIGIDNMPNGSNPHGVVYEKTDIVCDVNKGLPFEDNSVSEVYCGHFLEHVDNVTELVNEIYRCSIDGALLEIVVPIFEYFSVDHKTVFFPSWSRRYFDWERFTITEVQTREKRVVTSSGVDYDIFEQSIFVTVKKPI